MVGAARRPHGAASLSFCANGTPTWHITPRLAAMPPLQNYGSALAPLGNLVKSTTMLAGEEPSIRLRSRPHSGFRYVSHVEGYPGERYAVEMEDEPVQALHLKGEANVRFENLRVGFAVEVDTRL